MCHIYMCSVCVLCVYCVRGSGRVPLHAVRYSTLLYFTLLCLDSPVSAAPCSYIAALLALQLLFDSLLLFTNICQSPSFLPSHHSFLPPFFSPLFIRLLSSNSFIILFFLPPPSYTPLPPSSLPPLPPLPFSPLPLSSLPFSLLLVPQDHFRLISTLSVRT